MWKQDGYIISTDRTLLDIHVIHQFISTESYWGIGRSREAMEKAMNNSAFCFGLYDANSQMKQIGFARVVSDLLTFGYIADVFILSEYRGKALGTWLIETITQHPELKALRRITLLTETPDFYRNFNFKVFDQTSQTKFMERMDVRSPSKLV